MDLNLNDVWPTKEEDRNQEEISFISPEHKDAFKDHEEVCKKWRLTGRPKEKSHPAKSDKLASQRRLQKIARDCEAESALINHEELMSTFSTNISQVCNKLKKIRGENSKSMKIPFIETLCGTFEGENVLEGFRMNTEILCNEKTTEKYEINEFYQMCIMDNQIIFDLTSSEEINIPQMQ